MFPVFRLNRSNFLSHADFRSQKAVLKLGAEKNNEFTFTVNAVELPYFEYELKKKE